VRRTDERRDEIASVLLPNRRVTLDTELIGRDIDSIRPSRIIHPELPESTRTETERSAIVPVKTSGDDIAENSSTEDDVTIGSDCNELFDLDEKVIKSDVAEEFGPVLAADVGKSIAGLSVFPNRSKRMLLFLLRLRDVTGIPL